MTNNTVTAVNNNNAITLTALTVGGTTFVNLNPHALVLRLDAGEIIIPVSGLVARVDSTPVDDAPVGGIPATRTVYGSPVNLPDPIDGVVFLVSAFFSGRTGGRLDLYGPATGPKDGAVRNELGHIVAVTRLVHYGD